MKQIAIRTEFSFFYTDSDEIEAGVYQDKLDALENEMKLLLNKYGVESSGGHTTFYGLDKYSIGHCKQCDFLMVNRDANPAGFSSKEVVTEIDYVIRDGGEHEGALLCDECLPFTHRWGHHS